jgi:hypothetical protein
MTTTDILNELRKAVDSNKGYTFGINWVNDEIGLDLDSKIGSFGIIFDYDIKPEQREEQYTNEGRNALVDEGGDYYYATLLTLVTDGETDYEITDEHQQMIRDIFYGVSDENLH